MAHIFTYGSLMFEPVWRKLVKGNYPATKGVLSDYARRCVKEEDYPVIFKANEKVQGVVYYDVSDEDTKILDDFEGEFYERITVDIVTHTQTIQAEVYALKKAYFSIIDDIPWSEEAFEIEGMRRFLESYKGFI